MSRADQQRQQQDTLPLTWGRRGAPPGAPPAPTQQSGALQRWIGQVCAGVAEVAAGDRPARQMFLVMTPHALERLQRRARIHPSNNAPIRRVLSVRATRPRPDTIEATAVVEGARRCQAVAVQLRRRKQGWIVTAADPLTAISLRQP